MKLATLLTRTAFGLALISGLGTMARADTLADIKAAGKMVVVTEMQFPPFDFIENGEYTGFNKDLLDEVGKELGVAMTYQDLPWTSILPGLEAKKFDFVASPLNASRERLARYAFSSPIAFSAPAFIKKKGNDGIKTNADMAGRTVGAIKASAAVKALNAYSATLPAPITIREYSDAVQIYTDVANGRLEGGVSSLPNVSFAAAKRPEQLEALVPAFGDPNYCGWVTRKDPEDASLMAAVNAALEKIKADGRMAQIQTKWFGRTEELPAVMPDPGF